MEAKIWSNGLGWDIGNSEIWDCDKAFPGKYPKRTLLVNIMKGGYHWKQIISHKENPMEALKDCMKNGEIQKHENSWYQNGVKFVCAYCGQAISRKNSELKDRKRYCVSCFKSGKRIIVF